MTTNVPELHGVVTPGFEPVGEALLANFVDAGEVGAACCVYRDGVPVVDVWAGLADKEGPRPWTRDTIVIVFSCTKGVTAVAVNQLIERGVLDPDTPIAQYWPEFAANGKADIPLRWALSHRAGLAAIDGDLTIDDIVAWDPVVEAIAAQAPNWEPGTAHGYHVRSYGWILGEVIRRVTGLKPGEYIANEIVAPLDLDLFVGTPAEQDARIATLYPAEWTDPEMAKVAEQALSDSTTLLGRVMGGQSNLFRYDDRWNSRWLRGAQMPSSNGHADARSLARMYAACLGEIDGVRLLGPETVARATQVESSGTDCVIGQPRTFGLGFGLAPAFGATPGPATFGHSGLGGSTAFADPDAGVSFAYVMNQMKLSLADGDPRSQRLIDATYAALDRSSG